MQFMFDLETFARRIRVAIAALNIQQGEAAKQMDVAPSALSRICAARGRPNIETYGKITAWLEKVEAK